MAAIATPGRRSSSESSPWRHADPVLLALPLAISALGLLMIYSSTKTRLAKQGLSQLYYVERQSLAIVIGIMALAVVLAIDYRRIRDMWPLVYLAVLPLLVGVLVVGQRHKGAQAWFQVGPLQFQPSEITKVAVVVAIAGYCHQHRDDLERPPARRRDRDRRLRDGARVPPARPRAPRW